MSRSRKKSPFIIDHHSRTTKERKNIANRRVRRDKDFDISGCAYKKRSESWDICDYKWRWSIEEAIQEWYEEEASHYQDRGFNWRHDRFSSLEEWLSYWKKCVVRK